MLKRFFPNRKPSRKNRSQIYSFPKTARILAEVSLEKLQIAGIEGVILDLDNTIVSEDDCYLSPGAETWIQTAKSAGFKLFILSNSRYQYRVKAWSERLEIPAIHPAKKPFPSAFRRALSQMKLLPRQVVVIGDSRHTDILGAWFVGCPTVQVATLPHPSHWWERLFGKWVQTPYPLNFELWYLDAGSVY